MPIAGLVLTLSPDNQLQQHSVELLSTLATVTLGALQRGQKLPIATDTPSLEEQQELWQHIAQIPGILLIDLVFEDFSDIGEFSSEQLPSRWRSRQERHSEVGPCRSDCEPSSAETDATYEEQH